MILITFVPYEEQQSFLIVALPASFHLASPSVALPPLQRRLFWPLQFTSLPVRSSTAGFPCCWTEFAPCEVSTEADSNDNISPQVGIGDPSHLLVTRSLFTLPTVLTRSPPGWLPAPSQALALVFLHLPSFHSYSLGFVFLCYILNA